MYYLNCRLWSIAVISPMPNFWTVKQRMFHLSLWCHRFMGSWSGHCGGAAAFQRYLATTFSYRGVWPRGYRSYAHYCALLVGLTCTWSGEAGQDLPSHATYGSNGTFTATSTPPPPPPPPRAQHVNHVAESGLHTNYGQSLLITLRAESVRRTWYRQCGVT